ncbi:YdiU family protein, partial [Pelagibacteraceae bacterium]|nr:YdiU family protein [Pelagibacteraceae bacterium]
SWNFQNTYTGLPNIYYSNVKPDKHKNPRLILFNKELADDLNLNINSNDADICDFLLGYKINSKNFFSQAYAGHQFGNFTILGDGRALLLGEHVNKKQRFDIQLKGSGKTPYSRNGDGKATLGSMIREYIVSEAMHHLNIPTTRALAVIKTGEKILRDRYEPGAILVRVAKSHIRVGTFQFGRILKKNSDFENLISYTIDRLYPELRKQNNKHIMFFKKICDAQIKLIIEWMRVGFIHGVMNTDNMSLSGETIDYGPCAFMDTYNPKTVFSSIDNMGRYSFENQSKICFWNLARLAETILHLIDKDEKKAIKLIEEILFESREKFNNLWFKMMSKKLYLNEKKNNKNLINEFLDLMHIYKLDYTNTFIDLKNNNLDKNIFKNWIDKYMPKKNKILNKINPSIIPRNHIVERVINEINKENFRDLNDFISIIKTPYLEKISNKKYMMPPKEEEKIYETYCGT